MQNIKKSSLGKKTDDRTDFEISENGFQKYSQLMKEKQNIALGIIGGVSALIIGLAAWTGAMLLISYKLDWMALGVGLLIGYSIRLLGKGVEPKFGVIGAVLACIGSVAGNLLTACIASVQRTSNSFFSVLPHLSPEIAIYFLKAVIGPFDVIFCLGAVLIGYYFSFKPLKGQ